jgi:hypothetical protein
LLGGSPERAENPVGSPAGYNRRREVGPHHAGYSYFFLFRFLTFQVSVTGAPTLPA